MPDDSAIWRRRNMTWAELAAVYHLHPDWLSHTASQRLFERGQDGVLKRAPCADCGEQKERSELEPSRVCHSCRSNKLSHHPWWPEYQAARLRHLEKMKAQGYEPGDLISPTPTIPPEVSP